MSYPESLRLQCTYPAGDLVCLSAVIRELHRSHPGRYRTEVISSYAEIWENNPFITSLQGKESKSVECRYRDLKNTHADTGRHIVDGFADTLQNDLGIEFSIKDRTGDIHLSPTEETAPSPFATLSGINGPYWLIVAGGKHDLTVKWWRHDYYQEIVNHFEGRIPFVQIGDPHHFHPPLEKVIDQRGHTNIRQLMILIRHAEGIICPITFPMHLAAAVPRPSGAAPINCIVIAGGSETPTWGCYPQHSVVHSLGTLPCCLSKGCWKGRVQPLRDERPRDQASELCLNPIEGVARCMDEIHPPKIIDLVNERSTTNAESYWTPDRWRHLQPALRPTRHEMVDSLLSTKSSHGLLY